VVAPATEGYTFSASVNSCGGATFGAAATGYALLVNNLLVIDKWGGCAGPTSATVALTANVATKIEFRARQIGGAFGAALRWASPSVAFDTPPPSVLFYSSQPLPSFPRRTLVVPGN
jgi:hypothetical protein